MLYIYAITLFHYLGRAHVNYLNPITNLQKHVFHIIFNVPKLTHCKPSTKQFNIIFINNLCTFLVLKCMCTEAWYFAQKI